MKKITRIVTVEIKDTTVINDETKVRSKNEVIAGIKETLEYVFGAGCVNVVKVEDIFVDRGQA